MNNQWPGASVALRLPGSAEEFFALHQAAKMMSGSS
jgi:hypothetical protein